MRCFKLLKFYIFPSFSWTPLPFFSILVTQGFCLKLVDVCVHNLAQLWLGSNKFWLRNKDGLMKRLINDKTSFKEQLDVLFYSYYWLVKGFCNLLQKILILLNSSAQSFFPFVLLDFYSAYYWISCTSESNVVWTHVSWYVIEHYLWRFTCLCVHSGLPRLWRLFRKLFTYNLNFLFFLLKRIPFSMNWVWLD